VTTAASFTILQAVDGIALKRAVDAWAIAPTDQETAAFAAAEAVRWTEIGVNSLSFFLSGLTLFLYGVAIALGTVYPRWVGWMALVSGAALMYHGAVVVSYEGFGPSIPNLVGLVLLAVWAFIMAILMWRNSSRRRIARLESAPPGAAQHPPAHANSPSVWGRDSKQLRSAPFRLPVFTENPRRGVLGNPYAAHQIVMR
jgi:hypothetical protein